MKQELLNKADQLSAGLKHLAILKQNLMDIKYSEEQIKYKALEVATEEKIKTVSGKESFAKEQIFKNPIHADKIKLEKEIVWYENMLKGDEFKFRAMKTVMETTVLNK